MADADTISFDPGYGPLVPTRVRIATWNLWGRYGPWEERMPVIIENLGAINADILALQEVWEDDTRNQAIELAKALGCTEPVYARQSRARRRPLGQRGAFPLAHHASRSADPAAPGRARCRRRRRRGTAVPLRRGRRAARTDPDVLRAPELVGRPQRDPPGAGRRHLPLRPREAAAPVSGRAVRRPQRRPDERRDPHAHGPGHFARSARHLSRRVGSGGQHRSGLHMVERQPVRGGRASISTVASTT